MKYKYALFFVFIFYTSCNGQNKPDLPTSNTKSEVKDVITSYGPNSISRTIKQDRKGNIWIASWEGVFRYDGRSFTNVTKGVSSARFFSVLEDSKGNFWFSSVGSGVYYYDGVSFQNFTTKDGLANDEVIDIYEDKNGNIWFGTGGGVSRYDGKSFTLSGNKDDGKLFRNFTTKEGLSSNDVNSIIEDKTGKFWFGTRGHACFYDGKKFTVFTHNGKPFTNVRTIIEDRKGNIWLGGNDGLWRYDGSTFTNVSPDFVGYIYEDKNGNIWTSSESAGKQDYWVLSRYDAKSLSGEKPTATEIIEPKKGGIFGILVAYDESIWFGTSGVHRYDGNTITDFNDKERQK